MSKTIGNSEMFDQTAANLIGGQPMDTLDQFDLYNFEEDDSLNTKITVVGVGGGGGNAINQMINSGMKNVDFIAMNTDVQALKASKAEKKIILGARLTKGRGAGANQEIGKRAAEESQDEIRAVLKDSQMVFITAGMGGGTGTGAAHVVAEIAKDMGILTVGIVTKPFEFEGKRKMAIANIGITNLLKNIDSLITVPNERLKLASKEKLSMKNAFQLADGVLSQGVSSISSLINTPAFINLDFADVKAVMNNAGYAHMGVGEASGSGKSKKAAEAAISSPLLETSIAGAKGVIINIATSPDVTLEEVEETASMITSAANPDANIIWGTSFDDELRDTIRITVVATGFDEMSMKNIASMNDAKSAPAAISTASVKPIVEQESSKSQISIENSSAISAANKELTQMTHEEKIALAAKLRNETGGAQVSESFVASKIIAEAEEKRRNVEVPSFMNETKTPEAELYDAQVKMNQRAAQRQAYGQHQPIKPTRTSYYDDEEDDTEIDGLFNGVKALFGRKY